MPQCPTCKTPYEVGQRYCGQCSSYLLHPEEGDHFCPACGIRVAVQQEICHNCNAALAGKPGEPPTIPPPEAASGTGPAPSQTPNPWPPSGTDGPRSRMPSWVLAAFIGAVVVIVALLLIIFFKKSSAPEGAGAPAPKGEVKQAAPTPQPQEAASAPQPQETAPSPKPAASPTPAPAVATPTPTPTPPKPEATLAEQVKETLSTLREAQLKGDIILFMSCYSYVYPTLDRKRKETLGSWDDFPLISLEYTLDQIKTLSPESLVARVTWTIQVQNRRTEKIQDHTQVYDVVFAKELGKWRIFSLNEVQEEE